MSNSVEMEAKTVDMAVDLAKNELGLIDEMIDVEVLNEPSKGLLGLIGSKAAKVRVSLKEDYYLNRTKEFIDNLIEKMDLDVKAEYEETEDSLNVNISGEDVAPLIGKRGETLESVQYLLTLKLNRYKNCGKKIIVDIEGYREKRKNTLEELAKRLANKVIKYGKSVVLEPMSSYERRIIHAILQENDKVVTASSGNEPNRKVVIKLK